MKNNIKKLAWWKSSFKNSTLKSIVIKYFKKLRISISIRQSTCPSLRQVNSPQLKKTKINVSKNSKIHMLVYIILT